MKNFYFFKSFYRTSLNPKQKLTVLVSDFALSLRNKKSILLLFLVVLALSFSKINSLENRAFAFPYIAPSKFSDDYRFAKVYVMLAETYVSNGDYTKAKEFLSAAISHDPANKQARTDLGLLYEVLSDYKSAIFQYEEILKFDPDNRDVNYYLGLLYDKTGYNDKAIQYLERTIKLMPYNASVYYDIGIVFAKKTDYAKALYYNQQAVKLKPDFAEAYNNLCYAQANTGLYTEALDNCKKSLELTPSSAPSLDSTGFVYFEMKDYPNQNYIKQIREVI